MVNMVKITTPNTIKEYFTQILLGWILESAYYDFINVSPSL